MYKRNTESTADKVGCFGEIIELICDILVAIWIFGD